MYGAQPSVNRIVKDRSNLMRYLILILKMLSKSSMNVARKTAASAPSRTVSVRGSGEILSEIFGFPERSSPCSSSCYLDSLALLPVCVVDRISGTACKYLISNRRDTI